jgi:VWFA-related protein
MDRHGRYISGLKEDQFKLYEDGIEQQIAHFESAEGPFTVALLLDTSDSTEFELRDIQDSAAAFLDQLRRDDRVIVASFDSGIQELAQATSDHDVLKEAIRRARTGSGTSIYDAIDLIIKRRLQQVRGRKAIVLFTDGVDTTSQAASYESTLRAAEGLDALVYTIQYNTYDGQSETQSGVFSQGQRVRLATPRGEPLSVAYERANRYLRLLADKSGGRFFNADTPRRLGEVFARIASELREQYSLGYYPKNQIGGRERRQLSVRVNVSNIVVRARKSYVYSNQR